MVALVRLTVRYPDLDPVTRTEISVPASVRASSYVFEVAPEMVEPFRNHWYFSVTGDGPHVPGDAVKVEPTVGVPLSATFDGTESSRGTVRAALVTVTVV